jgi:hypothetical protein
MREEVRGEEAGVLGNGPRSARFWTCRNGAGLEGGLETGAGVEQKAHQVSFCNFHRGVLEKPTFPILWGTGEE